MQVISDVSNGTWPARIVATGYAQGGGLAKLAAVWAGAAYPGTQIRCIVFGAPRVGDARCATGSHAHSGAAVATEDRDTDRPSYRAVHKVASTTSVISLLARRYVCERVRVFSLW